MFVSVCVCVCVCVCMCVCVCVCVFSVLEESVNEILLQWKKETSLLLPVLACHWPDLCVLEH